ncbi:helix-turn-helix domain-containing protein [Paenibacillus sp. y28]|uniref:helix-turn-helix domain-containing protein n=1 Tax=Paenibacillus sp. y28 TaxID=3129110 RepID=UPI0030165F54
MLKHIQQMKYYPADTQTRLVFTMTIFVSFIILAVSLTSYYTSKAVLQSELSAPQHQALQIGMNYIDKFIQDTNNTSIKVALHPNVYRFLTMEEQNSYSNINELYQFLGTLLDNSPYLESIYIYDRMHDSFVAFPQGFSSRSLTFADSSWIDIADQFGDKVMLVRPRIAPAAVRNSGTDKITLFRKILIQGEFKGIIAVNFKSDQLLMNMQPDYVSGLNRMQFILDQNGELVYSAGVGTVNARIVKEALSRLGGEPFGDYVQDGDRLLISHVRSPLTEWDYVSLVSQDSLLAKSIVIRDVVLAVSFAALLLGGVAIFYTHSVAFKPVRRMRKMLTTYGQAEVSPDLVGLEHITGKLLNDHDKLSRLVRQTMPEASLKFIQDLFTGNLKSRKELEQKWTSYFPDWTDAPLTAAVISIDRYPEWAGRLPEQDQVLLKYALTNIMEELLSASWRSVCLDLGHDRIAIVLQPADGAGPPLKHKLDEAAQVVRRLLNFSVSAGFSKPYADAGKLKQAIHEADDALGYRLYFGYGSMVSYEDVADCGMGQGNAAEEAIQELLEAVETGSEERALRMAERLLNGIREEQWEPSAARSFLRELAAKLSRTARSKELSGAEESEEPRSYEALTLEDIAALVLAEAKRVAAQYADMMQSKEFIMVQHMMEFMKKHLGDNVGVQEIASSIGISVSLASQMFKQETNETIHEYLTKLRMERAGELLIETTSKISDIALQVGYQHENSFIRVFRKYKDITPGKYRELMRNHEAALNQLNS